MDIRIQKREKNLGYFVDIIDNNRFNSHELHELYKSVKLLITKSHKILSKMRSDLMMKRILPLFMLIGVIVASGCIGQPKPVQPGTNGLVITDFSPDETSVTAGDSVNLNLEVQNVGGATAKNINGNIYGVTFGSGAFDWERTQGDQSFVIAEQLLPPEQGIPGEISSPYIWVLKAPSGIKSDTTYSFDVRVDYHYSTDVTGILTFVSESYWNSLSKTEKDALISKAGVSQMTQTGGPISVTLYAGQRQRPFVVYKGQDTYHMRVTITNVGSGEPKGAITLATPQASSGMTVSCTTPSGGIILSRGKTANFPCDIKLNTPDSISNKQDFTIGLSFTYDWRVDSSTDITVQKPLT